MDQNLDITCRNISPYEHQKIKDYYREEHMRDMCRYGEIGCLLPNTSIQPLKDIHNMNLRSDDIFVNSFFKSGTTWIQEMIWLIANNLDYDTAYQRKLTDRYVFLETRLYFSEEMLSVLMKDDKLRRLCELTSLEGDNNIELVQSPRFFKTHLPIPLLSPNLLDTCKVVYIARDPRDVAVSFSYHTKLFKYTDETKTVKDTWELLMKDLIIMSPYFKHVKAAWQRRHHPNMLFLFYEELSKDLAAVVRRMATFLEKDINEEQTEKLCDHLNIKNFKKNKSVNLEEVTKLANGNISFIRKGQVGNWKEYFDAEMTQQAERWMADNLRDTDLTFEQINV